MQYNTEPINSEVHSANGLFVSVFVYYYFALFTNNITSLRYVGKRDIIKLNYTSSEKQNVLKMCYAAIKKVSNCSVKKIDNDYDKNKVVGLLKRSFILP